MRALLEFFCELTFCIGASYLFVLQRMWDNYSNSKMEAERYILQANGSLTDDGLTVLRTCALRLPGIYGPNERRHIPRVSGDLETPIRQAKLKHWICVRKGNAEP